MKVKMKTLACGPAGALEPGKTYDLPKAQAYALIEGGYADELGAPVPSKRAAEAATMAPGAETATAAGGKPK